MIHHDDRVIPPMENPRISTSFHPTWSMSAMASRAIMSRVSLSFRSDVAYVESPIPLHTSVHMPYLGPPTIPMIIHQNCRLIKHTTHGTFLSDSPGRFAYIDGNKGSQSDLKHALPTIITSGSFPLPKCSSPKTLYTSVAPSGRVNLCGCDSVCALIDICLVVGRNVCEKGRILRPCGNGS